MELTLLLLMTGCAAPITSINRPTYSVKVNNDQFDGFSTYEMENNCLQPMLASQNTCLNIRQFTSKEGETSYNLVLNYDASEWIFIGEGESLILLVDGKRLGFVGDGSSRYRRTSGYGIHEAAYYDITLKKITQIANAKEVNLKIIGDPYYTKAQFTKENFDNFKRFVSEFVNIKK